MAGVTTVREIMVDVFEYPHIPYWFTLRQAAGIVRNTLLGSEKHVQPLVVLVFDEKYNLVGTANLREIVKGLEPLWSAKGADAPAGAVSGSKPASESPVATAMRAIEAFVEPEASVQDAARIIVERGLELVPVLENRKKLIGVVRWQEVFEQCSRAALGGEVLRIHRRFFGGFVLALGGGALVGALATAGLGPIGTVSAAATLGGLLAAGIVVAHRLAGRINAPLRELETAMHRLAEGDFNATTLVPALDAENASLGVSFTQMRDHLHDTMNSLELAVATLHEKQEQLVEVEKLASLGRVAAGVAHEINNPLAIINEKAGLLQDLLGISGDFKNRERFAPLLQGITDSVQRCRTITHQLLGYARRVEVTVEPIELNREVQRVREYLESEIAAKAVGIELVLAEGLPEAYTDRIEFEQVLINIVKNAIDASPVGGTIGLATRAKNQRWLQVTVKDQGPGIPPEQLKQLFEPFFTTKEKGKGTGLGLFVSHGIMKKLGGRILVESSVGRGTTFTLELRVRYVAQEIAGE